ncbi:VgrG protein [Pseudomonas syringae pv. helianthi]|uniref:VgrG protein n=1 Tax=Pseudomonas syringae pv. helianthi TaxID=251654 RepID=A0A0P9R9V2_9PSED|nr:type VI secretion system Vgr family protein [Pseudomonas syringae group genomosp. 7]KPX41841.1 VgrG protein [Pseudomonas syringae pv. helianthi]UNB63771.1 type VI secretion system tip protein VgrG [Pseudomonas syringae pv. helianthi]
MISNALEQLTHQNNRLITFDSPLPPEQELRVESFSGREAISELFAFDVTLISSDARIELKTLVGKKVSLGLTLADGTVRHLSAHVSDFVHMGADGGVASYHARLVPWIWLLSRRSDARVFQDKTVEDVVREVFSYYPGIAAFEFRLSRSLKKISYCTQYMESDLNFVLRLLEAEGLFFTFQHSQDEHRMVILDDSRDLPALPAQPIIRYHRASVTEEADSITTWSSSRNLQPTKLTMKSFDYKQPGNPQLVQMKSIAEQGEVGDFETFDYEGLYGYTDLEDGQHKARNRLEAMEVLGKQFSGTSNCRVMEPGYFFELTQHYDHDQDSQEDRQFLLLSVNHSGQNNYLSQGTPGYQNSFECIRRKIPYRHRFSTPRAAIRGPQTAIIVGPLGEEIYTDEMGRVKVQFHWDRYGKFDDKSSCWVRVAQSGASGGFGSMQIPRVGDEVVVVFLDGNPDRPLVMGSLYNSQNTPPWSLPANKTQSGFLTRSAKGDGGTANFFRFEDKAGAEQVIVHAERNMDTEVELDETHQVGNNRKVTVGGTNTEVIQGDTLIKIEQGSLKITVDKQLVNISAMTEITLTVGSSSITLKPKSIEIKGDEIKILGTNTFVEGDRVDINIEKS